MRRGLLLLALFLGSASTAGCEQRRAAPARLSDQTTFAELRAVKGAVIVTPPGEPARAPYPRERLVEGERVEVPASGLAWLRRDGGATWLVSGPASLALYADRVEMTRGRAFVDSEQAAPALVTTPRGQIELSEARASLEVGEDHGVSAYVLRGSARVGEAARAGSGERLTLLGDGHAERSAVTSWHDWTGGLGSADPAAEPPPFGIGTVGARPPGEKGRARLSLVITQLDVKVSVDQDFAVTEVDQTFINPSSDTVEGLFRFRTPAGAVLQRFGVDRGGELVWGRIQESADAERQYQSNVYAGSEEDPALLSWQGAGTYEARLYPLTAGAERRVVTRYAEWLPRHGAHGERRLYVYPMAAEGARGSLPRIEELTVTFDLKRAGATSVRAGMGGTRVRDAVIVKAFDVVPRADLSLELFDAGRTDAVAYRAPHDLPADEAPRSADAAFARDVSRDEADYIAIPLRAPPPPAAQPPGFDLAVVIDTSAATEPAALAIARRMASSLLAHLGPEDRAALWAGDATLRPVADGSGALTALDADMRKAWLAGLAAAERGGATDLGAILTEAASRLDPNRRGAVVYVGDGDPSVGELLPAALSERMRRLPASTRVLAAAVGSRPNLALLENVVRGAPVEPVSDAYGAARAALRLIEAAGRTSWLDATLDLGPNVDGVLPRALPPIAADTTLMVVGRVKGRLPARLRLESGDESFEQPLIVRPLKDSGDLRRRWGEARMRELMQGGAGRASLVDIGRRFGVVSPVTSLYVPTRRETEQGRAGEPTEDEQVLDRFARERQLGRWKPWAGSPSFMASLVAKVAPADGEAGDDADGQGEGRAASAVQPSALEHDIPGDAFGGLAPEPEMRAQMADAEGRGAGAAPPSPSAGPLKEAMGFGDNKLIDRLAPDEASAVGNMWSEGLQGIGNMWGNEIGADREPETGRGFGSGHGRLGGSRPGRAPVLRMGKTVVLDGDTPPEVLRRIIRQNYGRFRLCYEQGLEQHPDLAGTVRAGITIGADGRPNDIRLVRSTIDDDAAERCILRAYQALQFPPPSQGRVRFEHPLVFGDSSGASPAPSAEPAPIEPVAVTGPLGAVRHVRAPCGPGADLPLADRVSLWRERLARESSVHAVLRVYRQALSDCEASEWRERSALLLQMLDGLSTTGDRVSLWRALLELSPLAADVIYRALLARVRSSSELKELHDALGLERIEPELLDTLLARARTPAERLGLLRGASEKFGDDMELALLVLDAYEDSGDDAGGRAWARKLRRRHDATAHVRTHVGEWYLRRAERGAGASARRDADEARRTFGELVEFAPEDPLSRRRLGDLLVAHGWYEQAQRQYETLAALTPDDSSVPLLLAVAAQGMGKVEEAVRWLEKAGASASPDAGSDVALAARALASAFLAWSREDSAKAGASDEVTRSRRRAARLASAERAEAVRVVLSWSHPELEPSLWTSALGSMMPARDNLPLFGVAQAFLDAAPPPRVELRLDPEDAARAARLGARARLTVLIDEGSDRERISHTDVRFEARAGEPPERLAYRLVDGALVEEAP